jgi:hypothetical protein
MTIAPVQPRNGLGTAGFVLGLLGVLFSMIPVVGLVAWPMVILGLVFGLLGWRRAQRGGATNKGLAIAGAVLSVIGLVICIVWLSLFGKAVNDVQVESTRVATVHYEVTGDAKGASISYSTYGDGMTINQESAATLPWSKDLQTSGLLKGGSLTVTSGQTGGTIVCKVVVDGKELKTATATGPYALASCGGF